MSNIIVQNDNDIFTNSNYETIPDEDNSEENVIVNISNLNRRIYNNTEWNNTAPVIKRTSLLQGLPFTIYSYAAGIFRSNNRFNLFGLIDSLTYISRLNILGALNIRPDITFTFLNEKKILDNYLATYNNGLFGSALNIFMNPNDFITMDNIIDKNSSTIVTENFDDSTYGISYNLISKISVNSLSSPTYFKLNPTKDKIMLNEVKLRKYNSIIFGGIDYEQISIIINNISMFPNLDDKGADGFLLEKYIFHYYIDLNFDSIREISKIYRYYEDISWSGTNGNIDISYSPTLNSGTYYFNRTYASLNQYDEYYGFTETNNRLREIINLSTNISLDYNDLFKYFFNNLFKCEYNYGQIYFFQKHKKIKYIYLPLDIPDNYDPDTYYIRERLDQNLIQIYNYKYDDDKKDSSEPEFSIILIPIGTSSSSIQSGNIGEFTFQKDFDYYIRGIFNRINEDSDLIISYTDQYNINSIGKYVPRNTIKINNVENKRNNKSKIFYTILCGLDDTLAFEFLESLKIYDSQPKRNGVNLKNIINKTYLCYFDGNTESFKKVLMKSNNTATLDYFNGLKKIINYNSNNSFQNLEYNNSNIIDTITNFIYNINEGKAFNIDVAKNNPLSYNNGIILGLDSILVIYLCQLYYNDFNRIFKSSEIFKAYINVITNNKNRPNNDKIEKLNKILLNKYNIDTNGNIIDTVTGQTYNSLYDLSLNLRDEFFINLSQFLRRDLLNISQKSFYKILNFENINYVDISGKLESVDIKTILIEDLNQIEDKWYDNTHKLLSEQYNSIINNNQNLYYNKILNYLSDYNNITNNLYSKYYQLSNNLSGISDEYIDINNYKDDISIYESYLLLRSFSLDYLYNDQIKEPGNINQNIPYKYDYYLELILIKKFKLLSLINIGETEDTVTQYFLNLSDYQYLDSFNFKKHEVKFYIYILERVRNKNSSLTQNEIKNKALKLITLFYKFNLNCVFSRDDYYKYINDKIISNLDISGTASDFYNYPIFTENIILDEFPVWSYSNLNRTLITGEFNQQNYLHEKVMNFTITDIFIKNLTYNTSIIQDYINYYLSNEILNYQNSNDIFILLKFIFKRNNTGLTHNLIEYFEFLNDSISDTGNRYIFYNETINETGYFKAILLCTNSIYLNILNTSNLPNIIYSNKFISLNDTERVNLFSKYKNYYENLSNNNNLYN